MAGLEGLDGIRDAAEDDGQLIIKVVCRRSRDGQRSIFSRNTFHTA